MQQRGQLHNHLDPSYHTSDGGFDDMRSEYERDSKTGKNGKFARGAGLIILLLVVLFVLQRFFLPFGPDLSSLFKIIPITGTILVIVIGLGLLTRARTGRRKPYDSEWMPKTEDIYSAGSADREKSADPVMDATAGPQPETVSEPGPRTGKKRGSKSSRESSSSSSFTSGEQREKGHDDDPYGYEMYRKWYRSREEKMFFGVCGGLAERFDVDPTVVRALFVLAFLSYGFSLVIYVVLAVVMPKKPQHSLL
jgi:phage shock protein C